MIKNRPVSHSPYNQPSAKSVQSWKSYSLSNSFRGKNEIWNERLYLVVREAIVQKIPEFYEIISQTGRGGSIGFHISYSEIVNTPKSVAKSE